MYSSDKLQELVNDYVRKGYDAGRIERACLTSKAFKHATAADLPIMIKEIKDLLQEHQNFDVIQKAVNSKLYVLMDLKNTIVSFDPITNIEVNYGTDSLQKFMDFRYLQPFLKPAISEYEPNNNSKVYKNENGQTVFNRYNPPQWKRDFFYKGMPIASAEMPELYRKFFLSLLNNDEESLNYLIHWVANSLKRKNMKMLGAIGKQRIGKGMLCQIIAELHGKKEGNGVTDVSGTKFGRQFNGVLDSRTFVEFSEFKVTTADERNNWKNLINTTFELEKKGIDSKMTINHVNVFITANDMNDVRIGPGDQRLSLINLTDRLLLDRVKELGFQTEQQVANAVTDPANIAQLAAYLWNLEVDLELVGRVFKSEALKNLQKSQLTEWQKEFLSNFCKTFPDQRKKLTEVSSWLREELNDNKIRPSAKSFENLLTTLAPLLKEVPGKSYFEVKREWVEEGGKKSRPVTLHIKPISEQPADEFLDKMQIVEE